MGELWSSFVGGKRLNGKAILIFAGIILVVGVSVFFLHRFQVRRNAGRLFEQAKVAEAGKNLQLAAQYLEQYLGLAPNDNEALLKLARLLNDQSSNSRARMRAYFMMDQVLRRESNRTDVRREAARNAMRLGLHRDGLAHLKYLETADPDAEFLQLRGRGQAGIFEYEKAAEDYEKAMAKAPKQTDIAFEYATLRRERLKLGEFADILIERTVQGDPRTPQTRLQAARYYAQHGMSKDAWRHLRPLLDELGPPNDEMLVLAGKTALALGEFDQARSLFIQGQKQAPADARMSRGLAQVEISQGNSEKALEVLKRSLQQDLPKDPFELFSLANLLLDADAVDQARALIVPLGKSGAAPLASLLEARLHMRKGSWGAAVRLLDVARVDRQFGKIIGKNANLLLAECHERLLNPDQKLDALQRAVDLDPNWVTAVRAQAIAMAALGKLEPAIAVLRRLAAESPLVKEDLARLLMNRNLQRPKNQRNWTEVTKLLGELPLAARETAAVTLLNAEILAQQDKLDDARKLVEAQRDRQPEQVGLWLFLIALAERKEAGAAPQAVLAEAEKRLGPRVEWVLTRAAHSLKAGPDEARKQLPQLLERVDQFKGPDLERLLFGLGSAFASVGDKASARRLWLQLSERAPDNLAVWLDLLDVAADAKEGEEARRILGQIRRLEAGEGPQTACAEAALRLALADPKDQQGLAEIRQFLKRAGAQRPSWGRVPLLEAMVFEREGKIPQALEKYKAAIDRGEVRLAVVRRTLKLMYEQKLYGEAAALVRKLPEQAMAQPAFGRLAAQVTLANPGADIDPDVARKQALELARKSVTADSKDHREFIWLGQIASLAGEKEEAEKAFRRACELNGAAPEAWTSLIFFLSRNDPKRAEVELAQASKRLPAEQAPLALGPCYEVLGKLPQAEEQYQAALSARPRDPTTQRTVAGFYERTGQVAKAATILQKLVESKEKDVEADQRWARRSLALNFAFQGGAERYADAHSLLRANEAAGPLTVEDRIAKALVQSTHPSHRRDAIAELEKLAALHTSVAEYQFHLARMYEQESKWDAAEKHLTALVAAHNKNPLYLAHYVNVLLRQKRASDARPWIDQLTELTPKALGTLEFRLLAHEALNEKPKALALVDAYAKEKDARLDFTARWLERLGQVERAQTTLQAFVASSKQPESVLALAQFFGRQKKLDEALSVCDQAWKQCAPEAVAGTCMTLLRAGTPTPEQRQRVENWLLAAQQKQPKIAYFSGLLAELYDQNGRTADAMAIYRRLLKENGKNVVVLNNLAFMLAIAKSDLPEAMKLINAAIAYHGPAAELLDTRAVVYLAMGRTKEALIDLTEANLQTPSRGQLFHTAQAHLGADDRKAAALALQQALDLGLTANDLHPLERAAFEKLRVELR